MIAGEIGVHERKHPATGRSFRQMLEATLVKDHNRPIDAAAVVRAIMEIRDSIRSTCDRADELGLSAEELAVYDAVADSHGGIDDEVLLRELVHEVVAGVKRNLKIDWTAEHRSDV